MTDKDKKAPMLKKDLENEQNIKNQDYPGEPNSKPKATDTKDIASEDPDKVPESNDPAGYSEKGKIKESPSKQRKS